MRNGCRGFGLAISLILASKSRNDGGGGLFGVGEAVFTACLNLEAIILRNFEAMDRFEVSMTVHE